MAYSAKAVANFFLEAARAQGVTLDPMQVQKLVYFAHGWHLGLLGRPLIAEPVEAWEYGPVVRSLYQALKHYGADPITQPIRDLEAIDERRFASVQPTVSDGPTRDFLRRIWEVYTPSPDGLVLYGHRASRESVELTRDYFRRCVGAIMVRRDLKLELDLLEDLERLLKQLNASAPEGKPDETDVDAAIAFERNLAHLGEYSDGLSLCPCGRFFMSRRPRARYHTEDCRKKFANTQDVRRLAGPAWLMLVDASFSERVSKLKDMQAVRDRRKNHENELIGLLQRYLDAWPQASDHGWRLDRASASTAQLAYPKNRFITLRGGRITRRLLEGHPHLKAALESLPDPGIHAAVERVTRKTRSKRPLI